MLEIHQRWCESHTFEQALLSAKEYMTEEDVFFYKNFYKHFSTPKCVLPKGHSDLVHVLKKFFPEQYAKKIKDCDTTPGDDDILYKNRARRIFPIQVNKKQYTVLNDLHKWKASKIFMKAAIPTEFGGTNFTIATAHFDLAAILMLQKGIEHTLPKDIEEKLLDRAQDIVVEFKDKASLLLMLMEILSALFRMKLLNLSGILIVMMIIRFNSVTLNLLNQTNI